MPIVSQSGYTVCVFVYTVKLLADSKRVLYTIADDHKQLVLLPKLTGMPYFYRAMHFSAKRGIAIACRLSVRPSVRL